MDSAKYCHKWVAELVDIVAKRGSDHYMYDFVCWATRSIICAWLHSMARGSTLIPGLSEQMGEYDKFATPAVNLIFLNPANAVLKGLADSRSDGIVVITKGGAVFASGSLVQVCRPGTQLRSILSRSA